MSTGGISFSGVGSGLPVQDWIDQMVAVERIPLDNLYTKKSSYSSIKSGLSTVESSFRSLNTIIQKFTDANIASSFDIFNSKLARSSDTDIATVTASNNATIQNVTLSIESLATATKAENSNFASTVVGTDVFTEIANDQGEEGTFNIYVDGVKNEITIEETDTLDTIAGKINTALGANVTASVVDGKFDITYDNTAITTLTLGSNADTSNFLNIMQLSTASATDNGDGTSSFESVSEVSNINFSGAIVGNAANLNITGDPITEGTFKIGEAEFTIDADTSLADLVSEINRDEDAGVSARIDVRSNKLVLTAKEAGKTAISLEDGTSNFLTSIGLITAGGDSLSSQTLGDNAIIYLNGSATPLEVNSNTITEDMSGIAGLTINLKNTTEVGETIDINVEQDTDEVKEALDSFLSKYNKLINDVDSFTGKGKSLHGEYTLINIKNSIRSITTDRVDGLSDYDSLAMIGITTGDVGKDVDDTSTNLKLDTDKLLEALQTNPDEVKTLLIGDSDAGITGIFQELEEKLDAVLDPINGYFEARDDSINATISSIDKSIARGEDRLESYREMITKQFASMDQYISQMQQQSQALTGI